MSEEYTTAYIFLAATALVAIPAGFYYIPKSIKLAKGVIKKINDLEKNVQNDFLKSNLQM